MAAVVLFTLTFSVIPRKSDRTTASLLNWIIVSPISASEKPRYFPPQKFILNHNGKIWMEEDNIMHDEQAAVSLLHFCVKHCCGGAVINIARHVMQVLVYHKCAICPTIAVISPLCWTKAASS